jgi:tRNA (cmo5U34)-methyltransferase
LFFEQNRQITTRSVDILDLFELYPIGGYLISSDIAYDLSSSAYPSILKVWLDMMKSAGIPDDELDKMRDAYGRDVAVLPPSEVGSLVAAGGFDAPVLFFQNLLIHAWSARRNTMVR